MNPDIPTRRRPGFVPVASASAVFKSPRPHRRLHRALLLIVVGLCIGTIDLSAADSAAKNTVSGSALHVGAAAVDLEADDSMIIAGGITPGKANGQEGRLRAVA